MGFYSRGRLSASHLVCADYSGNISQVYAKKGFKVIFMGKCVDRKLLMRCLLDIVNKLSLEYSMFSNWLLNKSHQMSEKSRSNDCYTLFVVLQRSHLVFHTYITSGSLNRLGAGPDYMQLQGVTSRSDH